MKTSMYATLVSLIPLLTTCVTISNHKLETTAHNVNHFKHTTEGAERYLVHVETGREGNRIS